MLSRRDLLLAAAAAAPPPSRFFHKGVNFTAEGSDAYRSERAQAMLRSLAGYGVNSIALVPYGFTRPGSTEVRFGGNRSMEGDDSIALMTKVAHAAGLKVFLKPQIWMGRSGFPGDLDLPDEAMRSAWFASYQLMAEHYARMAAQLKVDLLAVGVEFAKITRYEDSWRKIIRASRALYDGPLTYGAIQGPEFENLRFWDALDYIGLNNYYPLPDSLDTTEMVAKVETVAKRYRKPVIFPEAGYSSVENPNRDPWAERQRPLSLNDQARCYDALCRAFFSKPWFRGVYWWKVGSNGFGGPQDTTHTPWNKPAMDVVRRWYRR